MNATLSRTLAVLLPASALLPGGGLSATTLVLPATTTGTINHIFTTNTVQDIIAVSSPSFVTDLGTLSEITASLAAAPGNRFDVALPAGKTGYITFSLNYHGTLGVFNSTENWTHTDSFIGLSGVAPNLSSTNVYGRVNGNQINIQKTYTYTNPFSFESWDFALTSPFTSGGSMTYSLVQGAIYANYNNATDGGQFVTQQAVPEPRLALLAGLGLVSLLTRRHRSRLRA